MRFLLTLAALLLAWGGARAQTYEKYVEKSFDFIDKNDLVAAEESLKAAMRLEPGNPNNAYKGGHGLAHILAKHPGAEKNLLEVLQKGECYKHDTSRSKLFLIHGDAVAVLTKHRTGRLLITDYANLSPKEIERMKVNGKYHVKGEN